MKVKCPRCQTVSVVEDKQTEITSFVFACPNCTQKIRVRKPDLANTNTGIQVNDTSAGPNETEQYVLQREYSALESTSDKLAPNSVGINRYKKIIWILIAAGLAVAVILVLTSRKDPSAKMKSGLPLSPYYEGSIGEKLSIAMMLTESNGVLSGSYYYKNVGVPIRLEGKTDEKGNVFIKEYTSNGKNTGIFTGKIRPNYGIEGTWSTPDGSRTFAFNLYKTNSYEPPSSWFVFMASYPSEGREAAIQKKDYLQTKGLQAQLINSSDYSRMTANRWRVVLGPYYDIKDATEAQKRAREVVPDAYVGPAN